MNAERALLEPPSHTDGVSAAQPRPAAGPIRWWALTLFASALLLFWVQPMVARLLLPQLGGSPSVWNTCMVFFQVLLLAGYAYSHFLANRFSLKVQWAIHGTPLLAALLSLPIALPASINAPWEAQPTLWLLKNLFLMAGLPFFMLSTTGPLLQHWFSRSTRDPYFLYSASNLGSLVALLGYPLLLEPALRLKQQSSVWAAAYGVFLILFAGCALMTRRISGATTPDNIAPLPVEWSRRLRWVLMAFVPSSLMLGVTTFLTTDIASVPLLWVVPLALYLVTFILAFSHRKVVPSKILLKTLPIAVVALVFLMLTDTHNPAWLLIALHLLFFFIAALLCHTKLSEDRPASQHLTEFYLWLSVGGALGGSFNALVAPIIFRTIAEYPIMIVLACLVCGPRTEIRWLDWALPAALGITTATLAKYVTSPILIIFGLPIVVCYFLSKRPLAFALGVAAVMLGAQCFTAVHGKTLHVERNFFGAIRVTLDPGGELRRFYHGTTVHGCQYIDPGRAAEPLAYYHRTGPFGIAYDAFIARSSSSHIAAIGLGAGAVAAYGHAGQQWTFYEIDPAVLQVARNTNFFSFLARPGTSLDYKLGDARLRLREAAPANYGLIICDAFSSDVPPLHLMTLEAMDLYLSKLQPDGMLLFHISGRYLDLGPVLASLAKARGLVALECDEAAVVAAMKAGKYPSRWVAIARGAEHLGKLASDERWQPLQSRPGMRVWTDDYSNLLSIFDWR